VLGAVLFIDVVWFCGGKFPIVEFWQRHKCY
jgi:hypothetical protein